GRLRPASSPRASGPPRGRVLRGDGGDDAAGDGRRGRRPQGPLVRPRHVLERGVPAAATRLGVRRRGPGRPVTTRRISGALHYFRVHPDQWATRLGWLRHLGLDTVETYVPWNLHEPRPGAHR